MDSLENTDLVADERSLSEILLASQTSLGYKDTGKKVSPTLCPVFTFSALWNSFHRWENDFHCLKFF